MVGETKKRSFLWDREGISKVLNSAWLLVGMEIRHFIVVVLFAMAGAADYATPILRATGIALIAEFAASVCRDLGENTVANGVLLFAKMEILVLCLPLVDQVLEIAKELLNF